MIKRIDAHHQRSSSRYTLDAERWYFNAITSIQQVATLAAELKIKAQADGKDDSEPERILSMIGSYDGMKGKYVIMLSIIINIPYLKLLRE